jgi:hypothetical protein
MFTVGDFAKRGRVSARLSQVEARLRTIESEGLMSTDDIVIKSRPAVRLAELTATAASFAPQDIGPVIGPLFEELCALLDAAGVVSVGQALPATRTRHAARASSYTPGCRSPRAPATVSERSGS